MLNRIILAGNLGRDPEIQVTQHGREIAKFSLATSAKWKDKDGEWQKHTYWHHIVVYRDSTVCWIKDNLKKGDPVFVEGTLTYHHGEDKRGNAYRATHIKVSGQYGRVHCLRSKNPRAEAVEFSRLGHVFEDLKSEPFEIEEFFPESFESEDLESENSSLEDSQSNQQSQQ